MPMKLLALLGLCYASEAPTERQRALLVGMADVQARISDADYQPEHEALTATTDKSGGLDLTYEYAPTSREGLVDWLYHSLMIRRVIPQQPLTDDDLLQAAKSLARTKGYGIRALATEPLQWTHTTQCFELLRSKQTIGTLCVGERDHAIVLFAVDGLLLKEEGSLDALMGDRLKNLARFRL